MKNLYQINSWCILITILLYFTFWGGIIAQPVLGLIQTGMSLYILIHFKELNTLIKILFIIYILTTVATIILLRTMAENNNEGLGLLFLWIFISLLLAFFHLYITYKIKQS